MARSIECLSPEIQKMILGYLSTHESSLRAFACANKNCHIQASPFVYHTFQIELDRDQAPPQIFSNWAQEFRDFSRLQELKLLSYPGEELTKDSLQALGRHCIFLQDFTLSLRRSQGDSTEAYLYKALGSLPRLQSVSLDLHTAKSYSPDDIVEDDEGNFFNTAFDDEFDRKIPSELLQPGPDFSEACNGAMREQLINCAIDKTLARSIFDAISSGKPQISLPLEVLALKVTDAREIIGMVDRPAHFVSVLFQLCRPWRISRSIRDDRRHEIQVEETEQIPNRLLPPQTLKSWLEAIWRRVWPEKLSEEWQRYGKLISTLKDVIRHQTATIAATQNELPEIKHSQNVLQEQNGKLHDEVKALRAQIVATPTATATGSWAAVAAEGGNGTSPTTATTTETFGRYLPTDAANNHIRAALQSDAATQDAQVAGIGTTKTGYIIRFKNAESAEMARNNAEWLHKLGNNTKLVKPRFGVVVHRTPTEEFDGLNGVSLDASLQAKGIPTVARKWIVSFMSDRHANIGFDNFRTETELLVKAGLAQGSPLSPILFAFFNADLVDQPVESHGGASASIDDYFRWRVGRSAEENVAKIQTEDIPRIEESARRTGSCFAAEKTEFIHLTRKRREHLENVTFDGTDVKPSPTVKLLGVVFDQGLRWKEHVQQTIKRATRTSIALSGLRHLRPEQMRQLYQACVTPIVDYASTVWHDPLRDKTHLRHLNTVQRTSLIRILSAFRTVATTHVGGESSYTSYASSSSSPRAAHYRETTHSTA
ncbi:hypothetical protein CBS147337_10421 [Penicillium roqueforti]|nr:hypothetical protein CBS147337_10421 [Penicillium roqueforti]